MTLQGKSPARYFPSRLIFQLKAFRFGPIDSGFAVDFNDYPLVPDNNMFCKPLVIFDRRLIYILYGIETAGFSPVSMGIIDLHLVALVRPAGLLILRMT